MHRLPSILLFLFAINAAFCRATPGAAVPESRPRLNLADRSLFPPELYPGLERHSPDDLLLAGMAAQYPGRLTRTPPAPPPAPLRARDALTAALPNNIEYIRYRANDNGAIPAPSARLLLIDLRYFATGADSLASCVRLCENFAGTLPRFNLVGDYPSEGAKEITGKITPPAPDTPARHIVVLVNHGTAGPVEALLADLQARGKIILAGTPTAGRTANLTPLKNHAGWWRITGEIQPAADPRSLVGAGVTPRVRVPVQPDIELLAWQRVENGDSPPRALLRDADSSPSKENTAQERSSDPALRRGHDLLVALQIMNGDSAPAPQKPPQKPTAR
jgi:hypothetical protein